MTTVSEDIPAVERVLIDGIEQGLVAVLQIIIVASFMFYADATLAWTAMLPMPLLALGAVLYTKSARDRHRKVRTASSGMNSLLHDNVSGMRQIKAYAMEKEEHARFNESSGALKNATLHLMHVWSIYRPRHHERKHETGRFDGLFAPRAAFLRSHRAAPQPEPARPGRTRGR
jgi:ATP-binding cassette subfamily B protein/subfamily B ATP-binding cassette protein MsbA